MPPPMSIHVQAMSLSFLFQQVGLTDQRHASPTPWILKTEHMIEREPSRVIHQAVIPEQTAGRIANQNEPVGTRPRHHRGAERLVRPYHNGTGTCDADRLSGDPLA